MNYAWIYDRITRLSPAQLLLSVFGTAILAGAVLLSLPVASETGDSLPFLTALFTAASAVCVTGLVVVDTGSRFSLFGQIIILILIQSGGLGIMTFASIGFKLMGARLPITHQQALEDTFFQRSAAEEFSHAFPRMLKIVLTIEFVGFLMLFGGMQSQLPLAKALYSAFFHAISAFCNAGFSIYSDSMTQFQTNPLVMTALIALIILGGLGHIVLRELHAGLSALHSQRSTTGKRKRLSFHSRVVLAMSAALIVGGTLTLLAGGIKSHTTPEVTLGAALFQSVSARTAGFNSVHIGSLPLPALLILMILMFIGGAPGSCAGGIKITSFAIWVARVRSSLHGNPGVSLLGREIPSDLVLRAAAVIGLATVWNTIGVILLSFAMPTGTGLQDIIFEQISAFGTVGLSTGLTPLLSPAARLWIIATMFVGRLGPLTLLLSFVTQKNTNIKYAEGRVMVG